MGIWIRSQDKKSLLLCKSFDVDCNNDNYIILANYELKNNEKLYSPMGYYSSVEKAVLVLDMIQEHIESNKSEFWNRNYGEEWGGSIVTHSNNVFKMPQDIIIIDDDEVEV